MPFMVGKKSTVLRNLALQQRRPGMRGLRGLRGFRGLGCACKALGQDDPGDVFGSNYDPLANIPAAPPGGGPFGSYPNWDGSNAVSSVVVPTPTAVQLQTASTLIPPTPQEYATGVPYSGTGLNQFGLPSAAPASGIPGAPSLSFGVAPLPATVISQNTGASSLSAYLPYLVLGFGGIALISVLKRR